MKIDLDEKKTITDAAERIMRDKKLQLEFRKNPMKVVKTIAGTDLTNDILDRIVSLVENWMEMEEKKKKEKLKEEKKPEMQIPVKQMF